MREDTSTTQYANPEAAEVARISHNGLLDRFYGPAERVKLGNLRRQLEDDTHGWGEDNHFILARAALDSTASIDVRRADQPHLLAPAQGVVNPTRISRTELSFFNMVRNGNFDLIPQVGKSSRAEKAAAQRARELAPSATETVSASAPAIAPATDTPVAASGDVSVSDSSTTVTPPSAADEVASAAPAADDADTLATSLVTNLVTVQTTNTSPLTSPIPAANIATPPPSPDRLAVLEQQLQQLEAEQASLEAARQQAEAARAAQAARLQAEKQRVQLIAAKYQARATLAQQLNAALTQLAKVNARDEELSVLTAQLQQERQDLETRLAALPLPPDDEQLASASLLHLIVRGQTALNTVAPSPSMVSEATVTTSEITNQPDTSAPAAAPAAAPTIQSTDAPTAIPAIQTGEVVGAATNSVTNVAVRREPVATITTSIAPASASLLLSASKEAPSRLIPPPQSTVNNPLATPTRQLSSVGAISLHPQHSLNSWQRVGLMVLVVICIIALGWGIQNIMQGHQLIEQQKREASEVLDNAPMPPLTATLTMPSATPLPPKMPATATAIPATPTLAAVMVTSHPPQATMPVIEEAVPAPQISDTAAAPSPTPEPAAEDGDQPSPRTRPGGLAAPESPASPQPTAVTHATHLTYPRLGIDTAVVTVGKVAAKDKKGRLIRAADGTPETIWQTDPKRGSLHQDSQPCGSPTGNTIINGHNWGDGSGVFAHLPGAAKGDIITCQNADGASFQYRVASVKNLSYTDNSALYQTADPRLTLITCTDDGSLRVTVVATLLEGVTP